LTLIVLRRGDAYLDKSCSEHCILIYTLRSLAKLERILSLPSSSHAFPRHPHQRFDTEDLIKKLVVSGRRAFWDREKGVYVSGEEKQVSWASAVRRLLSLPLQRHLMLVFAADAV
jgi:hypothetical protein